MKSNTVDRRTFVRWSAALGGAAALAGVSGCTDDVPDPDSSGDDGDDGSPPEEPLQAGMEIGVAFTGPGGVTTTSSVDPDEPGGGRLVTVDDAEPGEAVTASWRETVEREVTPSEQATVGVGEDTPTPMVEILERSGTVTASGLADAHAALLPMFWDPESTTTDTSGMWLSREAYRELRDTRSTTWSADALTRISWVGTEVQERIDDAVENVDEVVLEAEDDFVDFDLMADGQSTSVEAIEALDSFGNRYVVLANEENPLVVKFTYNAVSVGATGFDTALWAVIKAVFSGYQVVSLDSG